MGPRRRDERALVVVLSPRAVLAALLPLVALLSAASFAGQVVDHALGIDGPVVRMLIHVTDVDREGSIPTWFQSVVLAACAGALWTVADDARDRRERWHRQWRALALAFLYLSLDELNALHERAIDPVRDALDLGGVLYLSWIVVAVPVLLVFLGLLLPFILALPSWTRAAFILSGAVYVAGAVGLEMVGGMLIEESGLDTLRYSVAAGGEELLEMLGMTLFLAAVAEHRRRTQGRSAVGEASRQEGPGVDVGSAVA